MTISALLVQHRRRHGRSERFGQHTSTTHFAAGWMKLREEVCGNDTQVMILLWGGLGQLAHRRRPKEESTCPSCLLPTEMTFSPFSWT